MGLFEFKMPDIGEGTAEAELVRWLVSVGDLVQVDEPVAEVITDKATIELPSVVAGRVSWLGGSPGDRIAIGAPLIRFQVEGNDTVGPEPIASDPIPETVKQAGSKGTKTFHNGALGPSVDLAADRPAAGRPVRSLASPAVRRRALEAGIDLRLIEGSGPAGRIGHADLDRHIHAKTQGSRIDAELNTQITEIPVIGLRRTIAERMALAKTHIPHMTYVEEVDVTEVEKLRQSLNRNSPTEAAKLTLLPFLIRALVRTISEHPEFNAHFDERAGVVRQYAGVHIGIATQTPNGLVVPVLRNAEARDLFGCAKEIKRLADMARLGKLAREDLSGSTITITSLGALGGLVTTPIINYPELAVIGVNKMQVRPIWDGGAFVPRTMMNLSSGFDHRIIDGWNAAMFVRRIKAFLEEPATMFIERS